MHLVDNPYFTILTASCRDAPFMQLYKVLTIKAIALCMFYYFYKHVLILGLPD